jgi:mRNA interferase HigB
MGLRVISPKRLSEFWNRHRDAQPPLRFWLQVTQHATWQNLLDVRRDFRHADAVKVASGKTVIVFNIHGNDYRLVTAIHYNRGVAYVLRVLTHEEYARGA